MERSNSLAIALAPSTIASRSRDENAPAVAELCRRLDGIPLAIELAAARVNSLSVTALAGEARRSLSSSRRRRAHCSAATADHARDDRLELRLALAPEQRVFERLSVFAGGCTLASAEAVCAGEDVATADILNLHLISGRQVDGHCRF